MSSSAVLAPKNEKYIKAVTDCKFWQDRKTRVCINPLLQQLLNQKHHFNLINYQNRWR